MHSLGTAQIVKVSARQLESLTLENVVWQLAFEKGLIVESYAGWGLHEHDFGAKRFRSMRLAIPLSLSCLEAMIGCRSSCWPIQRRTRDRLRNPCRRHPACSEERQLLRRRVGLMWPRGLVMVISHHKKRVKRQGIHAWLSRASEAVPSALGIRLTLETGCSRQCTHVVRHSDRSAGRAYPRIAPALSRVHTLRSERRQPGHCIST